MLSEIGHILTKLDEYIIVENMMPYGTINLNVGENDESCITSGWLRYSNK